MNIFADYIKSLEILYEKIGIFGLSVGDVIMMVLLCALVVLFIILLFVLVRLQLCTIGAIGKDYSEFPSEDREWYALATTMLSRAECIVGKQARNIIRGQPGIVLGDNGEFKSLGPIPFEGLIAVLVSLRKHAGAMILFPLIYRKKTRRILKLIL